MVRDRSGLQVAGAGTRGVLVETALALSHSAPQPERSRPADPCPRSPRPTRGCCRACGSHRQRSGLRSPHHCRRVRREGEWPSQAPAPVVRRSGTQLPARPGPRRPSPCDRRAFVGSGDRMGRPADNRPEERQRCAWASCPRAGRRLGSPSGAPRSAVPRMLRLKPSRNSAPVLVRTTKTLRRSS